MDSLVGFVSALFGVVLFVLVVMGVGLRFALSPVRRHQRRTREALVNALIKSGQTASEWSVLTGSERTAAKKRVTRLIFEMRLSGLPGADAVATWTSYKISQIRREAMDGGIDEDIVPHFSNQLRAWLKRPRRHTALFRDYIELWERTTTNADLTMQD
ncbi:hypothetical protein SAMN06295879_2058 [Agreia bicolorata]|uniref:Uncharacterized protein n=1 Tax=Agreia bicolorata TaxID=110935 RepID=A0A1T4Y1K1_9MICO|nr:hypothetical protein [Agreia bicolorata]SKA95672.1 hypothetical protein SAMN06295879_2058 [Agreia bicolorata]